MRLDARGAWEFDLANGVTVRLGRRQVDERFERFVATALKLVTQRGEDIAYVDMRYTNGFAIGWRGSAARGARPTTGSTQCLSARERNLIVGLDIGTSKVVALVGEVAPTARSS